MTSTESLYKSYRKPLFSLAYRMLGSVMDAEDIVQEAFIAYNQVPNREEIQNVRAFLYKIVTNRCLDLLRSSVKKRELYVGPWLPEPLVGLCNQEEDPSDIYLQHESISTAYLLLLQQLNAVERAIFLLREIFHYSYDEIAEMVGKTSANCRQIFHRAQRSIHFDPDQIPSITVAEGLVNDFVTSLTQGNKDRLLELLSDNVVLYADGGGKVRAGLIPVAGAHQVAGLLQNLLRMYSGKFDMTYIMVNGMPGLQLTLDSGLRYVYSFEFFEGHIHEIYIVANPDKLKHIQ
ncbi:RNA polymerase sigma-70 factor [Paenibacillus guangzhouensis]|uniref:RNA polymerase sigma-70 factor n=1 Tax=Paenibacillus guangzhouensis TaxID=1473112 RepID=UPI001D0F9E67|nr:RNA polymerase sigma-70 factor [Paenibacillus guangzhouensis]